MQKSRCEHYFYFQESSALYRILLTLNEQFYANADWEADEFFGILSYADKRAIQVPGEAH